MPRKSYTELLAWQKAMGLVVSVYRHTRNLPKAELYGLVPQVRKAGISIPSNTAEGQGRWSRKPFLLHLSIAHGSLCELETQIPPAHKLAYLNDQQQNGLINQCLEVKRLINGLAKSIR
jgi:four helix bundle protein